MRIYPRYLDGIAYFERVFPEGCALTDENINQFEGCNPRYVWWFMENICQDKRLYALCGVSESEGIVNSFGVWNCHGISNALFLADAPQKYTLFGHKVSKGYFEEVRRTLYKMLGDWRPKYCDEEGKEVSDKAAWADMPQEAIDYVREWPEFDPAMFQRITGIG